jgi:uncharacterized protein (DUF58 family)
MPDSKPFLHPEAVKRISRLELRARFIVEGFLSGMHRSPYYGQSIEFAQHREYAAGDDLRHVDWKVWARQDRLYVKQYEEETNLRCVLLVDVSQSMSYGRGPLNKYEYGCTLAASLAYLVLKQQDSIGCLAFDDRVRARVPTKTRSNHIFTIVDALAAVRPSDKTDMQGILQAAVDTFPRRSMMVIISDLLVDRAGLFRGIKLLRQHGHDVLMLHVLDDDELDFPFSGPARFEGMETEEQLNCNPRALREGYLAALQTYLEEVRRQCANHAVDYTLVRTSTPLDQPLVAFLSKRLAMQRRH